MSENRNDLMELLGGGTLVEYSDQAQKAVMQFDARPEFCHSDGGVGIVRAIGEPLNIDRDLRSGAGYFEHHADGKRGVFAGSGRDRLFGRFRGRFGL